METRICNCGDCRSAAERGAGLVAKMLKDNECPSYAFAVSHAMAVFSQYLCYEIARKRVGGIAPIALLSLEAHVSAIEKQIVDFMLPNNPGNGLYNDICKDLEKEMAALAARFKADHEAQEKDSPEIKKQG